MAPAGAVLALGGADPALQRAGIALCFGETQQANGGVQLAMRERQEAFGTSEKTGGDIAQATGAVEDIVVGIPPAVAADELSVGLGEHAQSQPRLPNYFVPCAAWFLPTCDGGRAAQVRPS
jgi:hypothetical protein